MTLAIVRHKMQFADDKEKHFKLQKLLTLTFETKFVLVNRFVAILKLFYLAGSRFFQPLNY